ncbi:MAG: Uma2 family endonuclease [Pirellulaceae bacterium]
MSTVPQKQFYKIEEYFALEQASSEKHEYYRGEIFLMAGASIRHNRIARNLLTQLTLQLRGKPCEPFGSDLRIAVKTYPLHTYPDLSVICGGPVMDSIDRHAATNPHTLIEVLSPSTEKYDRGEKFTLCRSLASLREYILVAQNQPHLERFVLQSNDKWLLHIYDGLEAVVDLPDLGCRLTMSDIYEGVTFGELKLRQDDDEE